MEFLIGETARHILTRERESREGERHTRAVGADATDSNLVSLVMLGTDREREREREREK